MPNQTSTGGIVAGTTTATGENAIDLDFLTNEHIICASPAPEEHLTQEQLYKAIQEVNEDIIQMDNHH